MDVKKAHPIDIWCYACDFKVRMDMVNGPDLTAEMYGVMHKAHNPTCPNNPPGREEADDLFRLEWTKL